LKDYLLQELSFHNSRYFGIFYKDNYVRLFYKKTDFNWV